MKSTLVFKALADETRQQIIWMLSEREMSAGEIGSVFQITQPSVSHHLSVLKVADLVLWRREGQRMLYSLNMAAIEDCLSSFTDRLKRPLTGSSSPTGSPGEVA